MEVHGIPFLRVLFSIDPALVTSPLKVCLSCWLVRHVEACAAIISSGSRQNNPTCRGIADGFEYHETHRQNKWVAGCRKFKQACFIRITEWICKVPELLEFLSKMESPLLQYSCILCGPRQFPI